MEYALSRCLGEIISSIELDIPSLTDQQVKDLEYEVNQKILAAIPATPHLYHDKDDPELKEVRVCKNQRSMEDSHVQKSQQDVLVIPISNLVSLLRVVTINLIFLMLWTFLPKHAWVSD